MCSDCEHKVCINCWMFETNIAKTSEHRRIIDGETGEEIKQETGNFVILELQRKELNLYQTYARYRIDNALLKGRKLDNQQNNDKIFLISGCDDGQIYFFTETEQTITLNSFDMPILEKLKIEERKFLN